MTYSSKPYTPMHTGTDWYCNVSLPYSANVTPVLNERASEWANKDAVQALNVLLFLSNF